MVNADSSFLVSCYLPDSHSILASQLAASHSGEIAITPLTILEVTNAIRFAVFRKLVTEASARLADDAFHADRMAGALRLFPMPVTAWTTARKLSLAHTCSLGARSLDVLHVAAAMELGADSFLTFDRRQARLARAEGLATPVEIP